MAYNVYLLVASSAVVYIGYIIWNLYPKPLPGTPHFPESTKRIFGDGPPLKAIQKATKEQSENIFALAQKIGSPIFQLLITKFGTPTFVLDDPREVEDILVRRNKEFDRSPLTAQLFKQILPHTTLAQTTTPALKAQKRLWSDVMNPEFLRRVVAPNLATAAQDLVKLWQVKLSQYGGQPFSVEHDFNDTALDAIWTAILGTKIGVLQHETEKLQNPSAPVDPETLHTIALVRHAVEEGNRIVDVGLASLWRGLTFFLMCLKPSYWKFLNDSKSELQKIMGAACERFHAMSVSTEDGDEESAHDTCAMDLVLRREIQTAKRKGLPPPDPTTDPAMLEELWLLLLAGHDSTANTLMWFVKHISACQGAQAELRRALQAAFPGNKSPTSAEILEADVPYLDAAIEEILRLVGTASITTRQALTDTEVLGQKIPKGSNVLMSLRITKPPFPVDENLRSATSRTAHAKKMRDGFAGESGRDLDKYEPRRWLYRDDEGKEVFDAYTMPTLTFGGGYRGCFGKRMAMMELKIIIATIMLNFEFLPLPEELASMAAIEKVFRKPQMANVKLRAV
ncbi:cytochrome P450 3A24 [Cladorrhinum sp. PSN259]|nr:cytochrome P450 3A24 [Cladorrhinum sp. PSN259]